MLKIIIPFKRWVQKYEDEDSLLGNLASDIQNDDRFPYRSQAYYIIHNHLVGMNACEVALTTFEQAWEKYEREAK